MACKPISLIKIKQTYLNSKDLNYFFFEFYKGKLSNCGFFFNLPKKQKKEKNLLHDTLMYMPLIYPREDILIHYHIPAPKFFLTRS